MRLHYECHECHGSECQFSLAVKHDSPDDVKPTVCPLELKLDGTERDRSDWYLLNGECPDCEGGGMQWPGSAYCPTCDGTGCEAHDGK